MADFEGGGRSRRRSAESASEKVRSVMVRLCCAGRGGVAYEFKETSGVLLAFNSCIPMVDFFLLNSRSLLPPEGGEEVDDIPG